MNEVLTLSTSDGWAKYSEEILILYGKVYPLFCLYPLLILPISVRLNPLFGLDTWTPVITVSSFHALVAKDY